MGSFGLSRRLKDKVVFVMGATGTGKTKLSIDLATRFSAEIINSDKMQVYQGLDVVTNKVTEEERRLVPHHLLGVVHPTDDFTASDFCQSATLAIDSVLSRGNLPIVAGGSNSYIEALVDGFGFRSRYECCFVWVDVSLPVLHSFVSDRVDQMVKAGLVEEVREMFDPEADYGRGIRRAIGVPEMDRYIRGENKVDPTTRARMLEEAIDEIKANTCKLSCCQVEKINRLATLSGWDIHRLDASHVFEKRGWEAEAAWDDLVRRPAEEIVSNFLISGTDEVATGHVIIPTGVATLSGGDIHRLDASHVFEKLGWEAEAAWDDLLRWPAEEIISNFVIAGTDEVATEHVIIPTGVAAAATTISTAMATAAAGATEGAVWTHHLIRRVAERLISVLGWEEGCYLHR